MGNEPLSKFITIDLGLLQKIDTAIQAAIEYESATGGSRKLGITGEVGEVLICHELGLHLARDPRSEGYDAVDDSSKLVQIKTRRSETEDTPKKAGRLSKFSEHEYDYALLGILDSQYRLIQIWRADYEVIDPIVRIQKRRNPALSTFIRVATQIYP
ncbi:hypothetical protein ACFLX7_02980 [Chloroflexota bacterium]